MRLHNKASTAMNGTLKPLVNVETDQPIQGLPLTAREAVRLNGKRDVLQKQRAMG